MIRAIKVLIPFLFLSATNIYPSYVKHSPNDVKVAGEWLYMLPSIDQGYLAGLVFVDESERHFAYRQDWQSGYRIEAIYNFCNCLNDTRFRWTHFPTFSLSRTVPFSVGNTVVPLPGFFPNFTIPSSEFTTRAKFDFYYFDMLLGQRLIYSPCFTLTIHEGIQYVHLDLKENLSFADDEFLLIWNSHMWGIGPEIDIESGYEIGNCFSITGRGYVSLLINEKQSKRNLIPSDSENFEAKNDHYWSIIPTMGMRFGLNYSRSFDLCNLCCGGLMKFEIEGGYEAILINRGIERIFQANFFSFNEQISFALHGPYLRAGISF